MGSEVVGSLALSPELKQPVLLLVARVRLAGPRPHQRRLGPWGAASFSLALAHVRQLVADVELLRIIHILCRI